MSTNQNNKHIYGHVAHGWEDIRTVFEQNLIDELDIGASLSIYYRGECVVDLCGGWKDVETKQEPYTHDTLQVVFSTSKGIMAAAVALCVERGWLDYDAPVARYWPEFTANGKENITIGDLLGHRAGLSYVDEELTTEDTYNWSRMTSLIAAQKPHWNPGTAHGYHAFTIGYAAGELVCRVDPQCRSFGQFIRDEIDREFYIGIPNDQIETRISPLLRKIVHIMNPIDTDFETERSATCSGAFPRGRPKMIYNEIEYHRAEIPAANGISNARTLARIYSKLIGDIHENDKIEKCLLSEKTLVEATKNITPLGELDRYSPHKPTRFAKGGFQIYDQCFDIFGEGVFGHAGFGGSCAFAYPPYQLAYAYVCNQLDPMSSSIDQRTIRLIQAMKTILEKPCSSI